MVRFHRRGILLTGLTAQNRECTVTIKTYQGCDNVKCVFVLGHEFGPCLLATNCDVSEAFEEYDERFGERVDMNDPALEDYEGWTTAQRIESAMNAGEIRVNSGGTTVWVSHYEWVREYQNIDDAKSALQRDFGNLSPVEYDPAV